MRLNTRSIYGAELQVCQLQGIPYSIRPSTTLNEKFEIFANEIPTVGSYTKMRYFAIGTGGHRLIAGADGRMLVDIIKHRVSDASLYQHMPFVLRLTTNDLPPEQQVKYALRKQVEIDGRLYFAYYLKRLDFTNTSSTLKKTIIVDGQKTVVPFVPNNDNLNPQPPVLDPAQTIPSMVNGTYLSTSSELIIDFTPNDVAEYIEAVKVIFGDERYADLSEIGLCAGQDRVRTVVDGNGQSINFNEAIGVQLVQSVSMYVNLAFTNQGTQFQLEVGSTEALLTEAEPAVIP